MNLIRLSGDMTHLLSIIVLLLKIRKTKSCSGISLKTQELYVIVFAARYIDLFTRYMSLYNTLMKLVFLGSSLAIVWYMRYHKVVKQTYDKEDTFRHYFLVLPCLVLALLIHNAFNAMEVLWAFSLYLEAVAILPQLVLLQRSRNIDNLTGNYVFLPRKHFYKYHLPSRWCCLHVVDYLTTWAYRALYVCNWVYRYFFEDHRVRWIPWVSGLVQTALYADFFYYYVKSILALISSCRVYEVQLEMRGKTVGVKNIDFPVNMLASLFRKRRLEQP